MIDDLHGLFITIVYGVGYSAYRSRTTSHNGRKRIYVNYLDRDLSARYEKLSFARKYEHLACRAEGTGRGGVLV